MNTRIIATILSGLIISSCVVKVNVKKDSKSSQLKSTTSEAPLNATGPEDFLKHLDNLHNAAADLVIKEFAKNDYVGTFRSSVRKYRGLIIAKSGEKVILADSFYSDEANYCRKSGLNVNGDDSHEILGLLLKTVVLAKLSETDLGKINASLAKEAQALSQFITLELGLKIDGTSSVVDENGIKVTKGIVTIKLLPIAGETIDDATKHSDDVEIISLNFERSLGADKVGSFASTIDLAYEKDGQPSDASGSIAVSRVKDGLDYVHDLVISFGTKGESASYSREVIVRDDHTQTNKFDVTEVLNSGSETESRHHSIVDIKAGTQCKGNGKDKYVEVPATTPNVKPTAPIDAEVSKSGPVQPQSPTQSPTQSPAQSPAQSPIQASVKN